MSVWTWTIIFHAGRAPAQWSEHLVVLEYRLGHLVCVISVAFIQSDGVGPLSLRILASVCAGLAAYC